MVKLRARSKAVAAFERHAEVCKVFSAPARLAIIDALREGKRSVSSVARATGLSGANVSQHLALMQERGVLVREKRGNSTLYGLADERITAAFDLMREVTGKRNAEGRRRTSALVVISRAPYDGTDAAWNALRLVGALMESGSSVHVFLLNEAVELASRNVVPEGSEFNLPATLSELIARGASVEVCGTCLTRCRRDREALVAGAVPSTMERLAERVAKCDKVLIF